jgi:hypothetical protein
MMAESLFLEEAAPPAVRTGRCADCGAVGQVTHVHFEGDDEEFWLCCCCRCFLAGYWPVKGCLYERQTQAADWAINDSEGRA